MNTYDWLITWWSGFSTCASMVLGWHLASRMRERRLRNRGWVEATLLGGPWDGERIKALLTVSEHVVSRRTVDGEQLGAVHRYVRTTDTTFAYRGTAG